MANKKPERRRSKRLALSCPVKVISEGGKVVAQTKALNISDGGVFLSLPIEALPGCGCTVKLDLSVPRFTPNTYMLEDVTCQAKVLRHQPLVDETLAGAALQFDPPVNLALEA